MGAYTNGDVAVSTVFFTEGDEGVDINTAEDWWYMEYLLAEGKASLPAIDRPPFHDQPKNP